MPPAVVRRAEIFVQKFSGLRLGAHHHVLAVVQLAAGHGQAADDDIFAGDAQHAHAQLNELHKIEAGVDVFLHHGRQLDDIAHRGRPNAAEQRRVEILLVGQAVDVAARRGRGVLALAQEKFALRAHQNAPALFQPAAVIFHSHGHIHLDAAEHVHDLPQGVHINGDIIINGQAEHLCDVLGQCIDAVFLIGRIGEDAVDLARRAADLAHQRVAGDLQHGHRMVRTIHPYIQDHIRLADGVALDGVLGAVIDAQHKDVHGAGQLVGHQCVRTALRRRQAAHLTGVEDTAHIPVYPAESKAQHQHDAQKHLGGGFARVFLSAPARGGSISRRGGMPRRTVSAALGGPARRTLPGGGGPARHGGTG